MFLFVHICVFGVITCAVKAAPGDSVNIQIPDGRLKGVESVTYDNQTNFYAFLGIPYAAPPIRDLRFKEPMPAIPWNDVRDATYERSACVQNFNPVTGSEDCLFINVFTIVPPGTNQSLLPVMVWIHGGGYIFGTGNIGLHGADRFLNNGVILVSMNYRLGVFGYLSTEDSSAPGNYGLKDQIAALKWVNKNIQYFGGDSNQVTIFGQSAGAASVHFILQSKASQGLYQNAISESGNSLNTWSITREPRKLAFQIGVVNGIFTLKSDDLVQSLRRVDYRRLQSSIAGPGLLELWDFWNGLPFAPYVENNVNGSVVTSYSYELQKYGDMNQVPLLTGYNSNEARDAAQLRWLVTLYSTQFNVLPETLVPKDMNAVDKQRASSDIRAFYFNNGLIRNDAKFVHYASDNLFVRGIYKSAQLQSRYAPTYLYRFSFSGGVQHKSFDPEGVAHAEELPYLFYSSNVTQTAEAAQLTSVRMIKMWTNFAKTGNPTPALDPVLGTNWPTIDSTDDGNMTYLDIGTDLIVHENPEEAEMKFWDQLYNQYGFQPYNTY